MLVKNREFVRKLREDMMTPHSNTWYDTLSEFQHGYYYPWNSHLGPYNGEAFFLEYLQQHITKDDVVLDVGCGHGQLTRDIATLCHMIYGYDRVENFIQLAEQQAQEHGVSNVHYILGNAKRLDRNGNRLIRIPIEDVKFDIIYSRRGPLHYIEDVRRVAKKPAKIIQLNPVPSNHPEWFHHLPRDVEVPNYSDNEFGIKASVERRLHQVGLTFDSCWFFDVPERFDAPYELYKYLFWYELESPKYTFDELRPQFDKIFKDYAKNGAVEIRHRRFLWTAHIV